MLIAVVCLLAGCGSSSNDESGLPACDDVWIEDADLPANYEGCADGDGEKAEEQIIDCESDARLIRHGDLYAKLPANQRIRQAGDDTAWDETVMYCEDADA